MRRVRRTGRGSGLHVPRSDAVTTHDTLTVARFRTPRAAAIAGIAFSALLMTAMWILWSTIPVDPHDTGAWLDVSPDRVMLALNLIPFAGVGFLWFIGVLRDRLGAREDRFFATVFLGSGLLFLAMLFVSAAALGAIIIVHTDMPAELMRSVAFGFGRAFVFNVMNIYAVKMAAVFMITTSTLAIRTGIVARWIALVGYAAAVVLLFGSQLLDFTFAVFPAWVLLVSVYILIDNVVRPSVSSAGSPG